MNVIAGTSGYSYKEWKGTFYPDALPAAKMLSFYAAQFASVEINNTYYKMPNAQTLEKWASEVPDGFTFVLKAPLRISHVNTTDADIRLFFDVAHVLASKLGPILYRPSYTAANADRLTHFLSRVPDGQRVCVELRHESWSAPANLTAALALLRARNAALCIADTDEHTDPLVATADWGYLRLRRASYTAAQLTAWAKRIRSQPWTGAYVFFKHEDEGRGPVFANKFREQLHKMHAF